MKRLLILGGTSEARELAGQVAGVAGLSAVLALAGRTQQPLDQGVPVRSGGFGGTKGLVEWLRDAGIDLIVDATHPYAVQMSRHASAAAAQAGLPIVHIERPEWVPEPDEIWIRAPDLAGAVAALPAGARAFTATGRSSVDLLAARADIYTCLRVIDPPGVPFPGRGEFVVGRPPFSVAAEKAVLRRHRATHLVVKNAGGNAARTKLTAAAHLGIPIVVIDRVPLPEGALTVRDARGGFEWLRTRLASA